ncbi:hypothetical protein SBRCBS47491_003962 [Sporothrix bragantina]|uniref:SnoaL-like domain-containing protein n=1 Tax=Sporothrix bragantina TaxID=671064 RepID=A0ABP0BJY4_9PEZI
MSSLADLEARVIAAEKLAQRKAQSTDNVQAHDRGAIENVFSKYMHLHNHFLDEDIKPLWVKRGTPGIHAQYTNNGVYTEYDSVMAYHSGRPAPPGKLILHETSTPVIEVAEDGETAQGYWLMSGVESGLTTAEQVSGVTDEGGAGMPDSLYEDPSHNVDGRRVWAHWVWCQYALDFLKQDGQWKIWHFRCLETARAPYGENWITFAGRNEFMFNKDLAYFGKDGRPVFMPTPDKKAESIAHVYGPNRSQTLAVQLPSPYKTFSDVKEY